LSFFHELKRRNVFRVAAAYAVASWLLIEISATLEDTLHLPAWADSLLAYFLILGFPVALFLSWAFEFTPDGIRKDTEVEPGQSSRVTTARRLDWAVIAMLAVAIIIFALGRFMPQPEPQANEQAVANAVDSMSGPDPEISLTTPELSVAVLPFVNMSSDPEQEYFSDGLTEELLNLLADINQLKVAARTSSFFYKDKVNQIPFTEIGRQLGVAHLLEGSVRRDGNQIRVTAQLIKVDDGFHLWSHTWDRELDSIFAIQDEIAAAVVEKLRIELLGELPHVTVVNTESWELTQQARFLWKRRSEGDWEKAFELFKRALELDENNAAAWLGISPLYVYVQEPPDDDAMMNALDKAMTLDPSNAEARARYALTFVWAGDLERARTEIQRALEIDPRDSFSLGVMADIYLDEGDMEQALSYQRRAVAADPLYILGVGSLISMLLELGHIDEAEHYAWNIHDVDPDSMMAKMAMALIRIAQGRTEEALELARQLPDEPVPQFGGVPRSEFLIMAYHRAGDSDRSAAVLEQYRTDFGDESPISIARLYAYTGEYDEAFVWIERALDDGPVFPGMVSDKSFDPMRLDPRWAEIAARLETD
jgi:TolB-like protein/cytochrome c-type biogenesis protein CcmH/NrfG